MVRINARWVEGIKSEHGLAQTVRELLGKPWCVAARLLYSWSCKFMGKTWKLLAGVTVVAGNKNAFLIIFRNCCLPCSLLVVVMSQRVPVLSLNIVGWQIV
jgi:hypothetical protein